MKLVLSIVTILLMNTALAGLIGTVPSKDKILTRIDKTTTSNSALSSRIKIAVWNMYKGKKLSWYRDYQDLLADSDIVLGQEFFLKDSMKSALENPYQRENILATSFLNNEGIATGVFTSSSVKAKSAQAFQSIDREPVANTPKLSLITTYPLESGQTLTIVNIHALNFVGINPFFKQVNGLIKAVKKLKGPVVFAGDFNTNAPSKTLSMKMLFKGAGFKEVKFSGKDSRMTFLGQKLDHIWYRGLELVDARVLGNVDGSDHKPMHAIFDTIE